jgi:Ser/Thr protein kinase RdoA (MazF antagonist)
MTEQVLNAYGFEKGTYQIDTIGTGLINHTWKVTSNESSFILQEINTSVFTMPDRIAKNISLIAEHLAEHVPGYHFVAPFKTLSGDNMVISEGRHFRLFPFVADSRTIDVVKTPQQAYEAAAAFGKFTRLLSDFNASLLQETLKDFHDLANRYQQFIHALSYGNPERIKSASATIDRASGYASIVNEYLEIRNDPEFKIRVTHHDTKISNVLFNHNDHALCVIDLDTVMPGYFISDLGDMMRTYLCPVSEEEKDLGKIEVRDDFYIAIVQGYASEMKDELTSNEKKHFVYAGQFMIYMQALRFLTDHLNDDKYYGAKYQGHNLMRAQNQLVLLEKLSAKKDQYENTII